MPECWAGWDRAALHSELCRPLSRRVRSMFKLPVGFSVWLFAFKRMHCIMALCVFRFARLPVEYVCCGLFDDSWWCCHDVSRAIRTTLRPSDPKTVRHDLRP
eukprot:8703588-Pyramimonas_sp.AAC.2